MSRWVFGRRSQQKLSTVHGDLFKVVEIALAGCPFDFTVICGHRDEEAQNEAHATGASKVVWPNSKHNPNPSRAVDLAPWINGSIPWHDEGSFYVLAGVVFASAAELGVQLRFGGDWNRNGLTEDQSFHDLGHFELY